MTSAKCGAQVLRTSTAYRSPAKLAGQLAVRSTPAKLAGAISRMQYLGGAISRTQYLAGQLAVRSTVVGVLVCLGYLAWGAVPSVSQGRISQAVGHRYGPTTSGGYYVRVEPRAVTMAHTQRPQVIVAVESAAGQPVDDVLVTFTPSEGTLTTGSSATRGGAVVGTFTAAPGSDSPRTAFLVITVEDVEITVFIDIVPAVFGR